MEQADLDNAIQTELFKEWIKCTDLGEREHIHRLYEVIEEAMIMIRRQANG